MFDAVRACTDCKGCTLQRKYQKKSQDNLRKQCTARAENKAMMAEITINYCYRSQCIGKNIN